MQPDNKVVTSVSHNNLELVTSFGKDANFVFVFKKTEKLASAIYMITNLFSESEPMKWTLRKKISELVSLTVGYKDTADESRFDLSYLMKTKILELVSLMEVSMHGGLISQMNFSILKNEFFNVTNALPSPNTAVFDSNKNVIKKSFFDLESVGVQHIQKHADENMDSVRKHENFDSNSYPIKRTFTNDIKDINGSPAKDELKRSSRQEIILNLIKKKKELTIKDIAEIIKDVSEKTIQRELNAFIAAGVLKRVGVRRWSKYSLY